MNGKTSGMTDMTVGKPMTLIAAFALPLLAGNVLQQLYNMVDSMVVGRFVGSVALAAVGTGFPIIFMISSLFMGLGMGATIMVSQFYGARDMDRVKRTVDTIYKGMLAGAVPMTILGMLVSGPLLHLIRVPADTYPDAHLYMLIIFAGFIGSLGYNVNAGILQGLGDSRTPLIFLAVACVMNIVLDLLFVVAFGWAVAGVAVATIIAQFFSWIFGVFYINRKYPELHIDFRKMTFDKDLFKEILRLGIPAGIQQALFSLGVMLLQALVNGYGSDFMAGYNGANKLDTFVFMPIQSFATATTTYAGQNIGAGRMDRVRGGTKASLILATVVGMAAALLLVAAGPLLLRLFSDKPAVIDAGMAYLYRVCPFYFLLAFQFILNGTMRGAGEMMTPMVSSIVSQWLARIPSAYILDHYFGRDSMFFCFAIGWVIGLIITGGFYLSGRWKNRSVTADLSQFPLE